MDRNDIFKRYELKYLLTIEQYNNILNSLKDKIILDKYGKALISNIYYDTPNYLLIRHSLEKPVYKEKLRIRGYGIIKDDSIVFIELKKKYDGIVYNKNEVFFSELIKLPFYLQKRIIMNLLYNFYEDNIYMITDKHINIIFSSLNKYNSIVILPNNILFNKNGDILFLSKKTDIHEYNFEFKDKASLPNGKFIEKIDASEYNTNYYCRLSNKDINFPLRIRTRKNGDKMTVKNMEGMKKINDIFTDMKIPKNLRDSWPLLVDNNDNILWLPGLKKSKFDIEKDCNCDIILTYY